MSLSIYIQKKERIKVTLFHSSYILLSSSFTYFNAEFPLSTVAAVTGTTKRSMSAVGFAVQLFQSVTKALGHGC